LRKRIASPLMLIFFVLMDTTAMQLLVSRAMQFSLTLVIIMIIGMLRGRMYGMLYGMVGGVLMDIASGTLGVMIFSGIAAGYIAGFIIYETNEQIIRRDVSRFKRWLSRFLTALGLLAAAELVMNIWQYYYVSLYSWNILFYALARIFLGALVTMILMPVMAWMFFGRRPRQIPAAKQEVKSF